MSREEILLEMLRRGPMTSAEAARTTGIPLRHCSVTLNRMWQKGRVDRSAERVWPESGVGCGAYLYSRKAYRQWTTTELALIREMAASRRDRIAERLGRTQRAVVEMARRADIKLRGPLRGRWDAGALARVKARRAAGDSIRQLAKTTGIPLGTLRHWLYDRREA